MNDESNQQQYYPPAQPYYPPQQPPSRLTLTTLAVVGIVLLLIIVIWAIAIAPNLYQSKYELTISGENRSSDRVYVNIYIDDQLKSEFGIDPGKTVVRSYVLSEGEHTIRIRTCGDLVETIYMDSDKTYGYYVG